MPREKPWLWRLTAMISSSRLMLSMHSVRSLYLHANATLYTTRTQISLDPPTHALFNMRPVKVAVPTHTGQCFATDLALAGALSDMQILLVGVLTGLQL